MKVGIYALARNEAANVPHWEESSREAHVRVVTDTGSTDETVALLEAAGVTVARGSPAPWRWDDAHNLSLSHLPIDCDVCIRLDLDEVLAPGWRAALESDWQPGITKLRYWYHWSEAVRFQGDRVHSRCGYRWQGATHEGLVCWHGSERMAFSEAFQIRHRRAPGKRHSTDLALLEQAVRETPTDVRMRWYLARELDYQADARAAEAFEEYLALPGGAVTERAYARRVLARLRPDHRTRHLFAAMLESDREPESYLACAEAARGMGDTVAALHFARGAAACPPASQTHASDPRAYGPAAPQLAYECAWELGLFGEALQHAREAALRAPHDAMIVANLAYLERILSEPGPRAG
jgi:tetratricopeptide (TPR) repeat protein